MDFEKIRTDFEKRYGNPCENIYFAGKKIEIFRGKGMSVSACLTVGEALAVTHRDDGKITLQFSGSDDMVAFNATELLKHRKNKLAELLIKAKDFGISPLGADIFIFKNTGITNLFEPLALGSLSAFCKNVPQKEKLLPLFENFTENIQTLSGRRKCFSIFDGQKMSYASFFGGKYKVVLSCDEKGKPLEEVPQKPSLEEGISAMKKGDAEGFGALLDKDAGVFLKGCKESKAHGLYFAAYNSGDAAGSGILEGGDIFSFVENGKIDRFVRNTSSRYKKYFGGAPKFYVTDFADSGFFVKKG